MPDLFDRLDALAPDRRDAFLALLAERGPEFDVHPASFAQRRMWLLGQLHPESRAYSCPFAFRLTGRLDTRALERALAGLIARHDALRTVFIEVDGEPRQLVLPGVPFALDVARAPEASDPEAWAADRAAREARRPFDLRRGPPIRASALHLGGDRWLLVLVLHHIVADGWSLTILLRELELLYEAELGGRRADLPPLEVRYSDYARWQHERMGGEEREVQLRYWRDLLAEAPRLLELPADRPRRAAPSTGGRQHAFAWPAATSRAVDAFCRSHGVTPFMALLAGWTALLHRYNGSAEVVVGAPFANRARPEVEGVVGLFVNTVAMRTRVPDGATFRDLVARVREATLGAQAHQELPFDLLVDALQPERSLSHNPIYQVIFVVQDDGIRTLRLRGLDARPEPIHAGGSTVDLTLEVLPGPAGLEGTATYDADLFEPRTVERMVGHYLTLVEAALASPDRQVADLPLLAPRERAELAAWSAGPAAAAPARRLDDLFREQARRSPDAIAVEGDALRLTYRELEERAGRLARRLARLGVGRERLAGVLVERSPELVVGLLGVLEAGGAYVPLDPSYPAERLRSMLEDSGAAVLVTQSHLRDRVGGYAGEVVCLDDARPDDPAPLAPPPDGVDDLAYVIYTSGSTGRPKGVMVTHRQLGAYCHALRDVLAPSGSLAGWRFGLVSTPATDLGNTAIFPALAFGGCLRVLSAEAAMDGDAFASAVADAPLDVLKTTPTQLRALLQTAAPGQVVPRRWLIAGGESLSWDLVDQLTGRGGGRVLCHYGPTETTVGCSTHEAAARGARAATVPIGRPLAGMALHVLDRRGEPVPAGVPGELYVGGPQVARGYLGRPAATAERFVPDPLGGAPGGRLYRTGDLARRLGDGTVEFLGRIDHQVKVRGFRVEPAEVESVLERHPDVGAAVVRAWSGAGGEARLAAYVLPRPGRAPAAPELRRHVAAALPDHMVPAAFVTLDRLPLLANGKVDRARLPEPDRERPELRQEYVAPGTPLEERVAGVWSAVLGVDRVGVHDGFFELGGSSVLLVRARARLRQALGRDVPMVALFQHPTVRALAAHLAGGDEPRAPGGDGADRRARARLERSRRGAALRSDREGGR
ncbi:MAG: amino acid adenylation domain-containing protein [Chloroflexi bacterium]|nr:MAG: amino acid adenylation domain-containing protein [Chloroflexota bacterium]